MLLSLRRVYLIILIKEEIIDVMAAASSSSNFSFRRPFLLVDNRSTDRPAMKRMLRICRNRESPF